VGSGNVHRILDFIEDITLNASLFEHRVLKPLVEYGKTELLLQAINMYFERFGDSDKRNLIIKTLRSAAEIGNIDVINEVLSKHGETFDSFDLKSFGTMGVSPNIQISIGAAVGKHPDIVKNALEKLIQAGALDITENYNKIIRQIVIDSKYWGGHASEHLVRETLKEIGLVAKDDYSIPR
jgi:hypothetical protein